jgi:hypothetical protein
MFVGVVGFIGSGKGAVGDILSKFNFEKISFASHLKDVTSVMFGWDRKLLEGDTVESRKFREDVDLFWSKKLNRKFTPRLALQLMGTEVGRNIFGQDLWIHALENKIKDQDENFVITDVRFQNEIDWVRKQNGILIEIRRDKLPLWYNVADKANNGCQHSIRVMNEIEIHESEWKWIGKQNVDHVIRNDGSLDDLEKNIISCLQMFYGHVIVDELTKGVLL